MGGRDDPIGVILAGGLGRRIGGGKAMVNLRGRPLISYPLEAVWRALGSAAIVAKIDSPLPNLPGVTVWHEPDTPHHPLVGIVHALGLAEGRSVVVCGLDFPLVDAELISTIAGADARGAPAVVAAGEGRLQPLVARYEPAALAPLASALEAADDIRLTDAVAALEPRAHVVADPESLFNVNSPDDLLLADAMLERRRAATRR
jgi:molybdopterin-guanine dinucleotide biosynthesis protein A